MRLRSSGHTDPEIISFIGTHAEEYYSLMLGERLEQDRKLISQLNGKKTLLQYRSLVRLQEEMQEMLKELKPMIQDIEIAPKERIKAIEIYHEILMNLLVNQKDIFQIVADEGYL